MDVQFELPSRGDVSKCVVTKETIERGIRPMLVTDSTNEFDAVDGDLGEQAS
jgi:ATP-dependent Clp protease ATP-binding subunit ClpX